MNIQIQAVNFNADKKLVKHIEDKIQTLTRYYDHIVGAEVYLKVQKTSEKDNKLLDLKISIPGKDHVVKKTSSTFEDALLQSVSSMKETLKRFKDKQRAS